LVFIIVFIILVITFIQGICNYIAETNHVSRVYSVAAVLYLQFELHVMFIIIIIIIVVVVGTLKQ